MQTSLTYSNALLNDLIATARTPWQSQYTAAPYIDALYSQQRVLVHAKSATTYSVHVLNPYSINRAIK
jgi:hypothetical protein